MQVVEQVEKVDEADDQDKIDEGLGKEAEGCGAADSLIFVGDPLVDGPKQEEEEEADDPGADDAAGFNAGGEDVVVEQADAWHEEGAEKGEEDLSAGGAIYDGEGWQSGSYLPRRYKKMTRTGPGHNNVWSCCGDQ